MSKPTFEDCYEIISKEIDKRQGRWQLSSVTYLDFSDVKQQLLIHINNKWHLYNYPLPLENWLSRVISRQMINMVRNCWTSFSPPCTRCAASEFDNSCRIYEIKSSVCPLYASWEKGQKQKHDVRLPLPLDNHTQQVYDIPFNELDIEATALVIHSKMQEILKPIEWKAYKLIFVEHKTDLEVAKAMGYKTSEKYRQAGYRQINNLKKIIIEKAKEIINNGDIDFIK